MLLPEFLLRSCGWCLVVVIAAACLPAACGDDDQDRALALKSLVSPGDTARLQQILAKARRGDPVVVGVIGGSITAGAAASAPEKRYGDLLAKWFRDLFPGLQVEFVNAGIGATGSNYGALRARRDLLAKKPDFVVVEFGVNDPNTQEAAETLEGLVRQILAQPNQPAVVLLFTMDRAGANAQEWQGKVGEHYGLPMVSFRDALWPEIAEGRMRWEDVEADEVHPNDRGHAYLARYVGTLLGRTLAAMPPDDDLPKIRPIPEPLFSARFEHVALHEAEALRPVSSTGWTYDGANEWTKGWKADQPGSVIEFEVTGETILLMEYHVRGPMGQARVQVDDQPPTVVDGWFEGTWGGWRNTHELARGLGPGKHRVRLEILPEQHAESTGHEFRVLGLGAAGVP
jgi:lysophospholipase L1-like esterase